MSAIQQNLSLFHHLENVLRQAKARNAPMSTRDIWEVPLIKQIAKNEQQVRDKLKTLADNGLLTTHTIAMSQGGDRRAKIGYTWRDEAKTADVVQIRKPPQPQADRPSSSQPMAVETPPLPVGIDVKVKGNQIVISLQHIRITIEA